VTPSAANAQSDALGRPQRTSCEERREALGAGVEEGGGISADLALGRAERK